MQVACEQCKKVFNKTPWAIKRRKRHFCSKECSNLGSHKFRKGIRPKNLDSLLGINHWNWKGGVTPKNRLIRGTQEYKLWREAVFKRDNWTCIWCGIRSKKGTQVYLQADHIKPFAQYPELRFAIDNGRTLCLDCHKTTDSYLNKNRWKQKNIN